MRTGWSSTSATAPEAIGPETGRTESNKNHVTIRQLQDVQSGGSADAKQSAFLNEHSGGRMSCARTGRGRDQSASGGAERRPGRRKTRRGARRWWGLARGTDALGERRARGGQRRLRDSQRVHGPRGRGRERQPRGAGR